MNGDTAGSIWVGDRARLGRCGLRPRGPHDILEHEWAEIAGSADESR
jgi:hypothetical protein